MEIRRTGEDIRTVGDFLTLVKDGEKLGTFYCEGGGDGKSPPGGCGKNLNSLISSLPNDGQDHFQRCTRCGRLLHFSAGWLAAKILKADQNRLAGGVPAVGSFPDVKGIEERPHTPRKQIIVRPFGAIAGARSR